MAEICPVCNKKIGFNDEFVPTDTGSGQPYYEIHVSCKEDFDASPEEYGGKAIEKTEAQINLEKEASEQRIINQKQQQKIEDKSVYVKGFSMPFGEMVIFALKWMLAMIPALILFWIIIALFTALFGVSLMSIFL
jgi:hypothetical protein